MSEAKLRHIQVERDSEDIVHIALDVAGADANTLSSEVIDELEQALDSLNHSHPAGIVFSSRKPGFIAGADVHELDRIKTSAEAAALIDRGQKLMDRIAALGSPTVARIHGHCLGGGLELALACRYRVADDDPGTRLGLPEVRLGIHPGFGGSARLPAQIGPLAALDLMLSGRSVGARDARRMGLIDYCLPPWQLDEAARRLILDDPGPHRPATWQRLAGYSPVRALLRPLMERRLRSRARPAHYPAPYALLDLWGRHGGDPLPRRLRAERESLVRLVEEGTAANLVRVFLLRDRMKSEARSEGAAVARHVHVVGAGTMGGDIAAWLALHECTVTLVDERPEAIASTLRRARQLFARRLVRGHAITAAMDRLVPDPVGRGAARADLIIEAITEDADAKRHLFAQLEEAMRPDAVLATNTSSLPIESLARDLDQPGRLIGLHFFNPVAKMPLVEVVAGEQSDDEAIARGQALMAAADKLPLRVASGPGFLVNRLLMPYMLKAARMYAENRRREDIDAAARRFGMPMGPLELADSVGLDVCVAAADVMTEARGLEVPERLRQLVAAGRLGRKSGRGFYEYRNDKPRRQRPSRDAVMLDEMGRDLIEPLLEEAERCLEEGVVADADLVDAGAVFGTGFAPFTGGPLHHLRQRREQRTPEGELF